MLGKILRKLLGMQVEVEWEDGSTEVIDEEKFSGSTKPGTTIHDATKEIHQKRGSVKEDFHEINPN